jgi:EAL domain-containing protein (putative c-di-GMP-specific phosphodiesterase class I)
VQDALELLQALLRKATATGQDTLVLGKGKARERLLRQLQRRRQELRWIPRAIHRKEVELFYQDIRALRAQGGERDREALARIRHQSRAMPASAFMDTVYDLRLCVELDCLVLEQLLHYAPGLGHLQGRLFVNVSPLSLRCSRYRALLEQALGSLPALVLELSEQALLQEPALARELHRQLGVRFALDDFGTGYSCLKTLAELASEEVLLGLKIDGPLIRAMDTSRATRDIVLSIGRMAKALGLRSIAEYVENASTARALRLMGIDYAQGFFFHQPQHIEGLLREARA